MEKEKHIKLEKDVNINSSVKVAQKKKKNLSKAEKKVLKYVQDTIPYETVFADGIFVNKYGEYSVVYPIQDVNFKIESQDVQEDIYTNYMDLFNSFSSDTHLQISLVNKYLDKEKFHDIIFAKHLGDAQDVLRDEFNGVLEGKEKVGDNEIVKERFLTVSTAADSVEKARIKFAHIDGVVKRCFESINHTSPDRLTAVERLEMLYDFYNAGQESDFLLAYRNGESRVDIKKFDINILGEYGLTTKDVVCPNYFEFGSDKMIVGDRYAQALAVQDFSTELTSDFLVDLNNMHCSMITSVHFEIVDREQAARSTARMQTVINSQVIEAQKKNAKEGISTDIISPKLKYDMESIQDIRDSIQKENQKLIKTSIIIVHTASTLEKLAEQEAELKSIGRQRSMQIVVLKQQQERALNSVIPMGRNEILLYKSLPTKCASILLPFELQELTQRNGFYYGLNTLSNRMILYNRKTGDNYNALILGRSGSGKSFKAKEEILSSYLRTPDDIIILDPQGEYTPFVKALGGEAINFSAGCGTFINPFDMDITYADDRESEDGQHTNPLVLKNSYIASICEAAINSHFGLSAAQKSIIDRVLNIIYADFLKSGKQEDIPTMQDFYYTLLKQSEVEALALAKPLEQFAVGSLDLFAHKTNVVLTNRLTCYNIQHLTNAALKEMALIACLNDIWNRVLDNHRKHKFTWIYLDEFHLFLKSEVISDFLKSIWKRARKFGGGPTGITQNISDLLNSQASEAILSNSSLIMMLNQAPIDKANLSKILNISETQQKYITNAKRGSGLLWTGNAVIPFTDEFPTDTHLYTIMSTNATETYLSEAVADEKLEKLHAPETQEEKERREMDEYVENQTEMYKKELKEDRQANVPNIFKL